jgi:spore germination protein GerM
MRRLRWPAVLVVSATLAAGCAGDDTNGEGTTTTSRGTVTSAPTTFSPADGTIAVQVFFLDEDAFNIGRPPYVTPVERQVDADQPAAGALDALFAGPTAEESAGGLRFVASEATGYTGLRIEDGTAHVQLTGGCSSGGSTFTIAGEIVPTLTQFSEVEAVKVYDPEGNTGAPDEPGDSIPFCLEP